MADAQRGVDLEWRASLACIPHTLPFLNLFRVLASSYNVNSLNRERRSFVCHLVHMESLYSKDSTSNIS